MTENVSKRKRPSVLQSKTMSRKSPHGTVFLTVGILAPSLDSDTAEPFEVFVNVGKRGSEVYALGEAIGRLISLTLRLDELGTPTERLQLIADQLAGIGGGRIHIEKGETTYSIPDTIGQMLGGQSDVEDCG